MIVRVEDYEVFANSELQQFLLKAVEDSKCSDFVGAVREIAACVKLQSCGVFVGIEEGNPKALGVVFLPTPLMECPQVVIFFNIGSRSLGKALADALVEFIKSKGYNKAWVINRSERSDEAMTRLFAHIGFVKTVGSILEYEF